MSKKRTLLAAARFLSGISQAEVAERLNVEQPTVSRWELGQSRPSLEQAQELAEMFQTPAELLFPDLFRDKNVA